jgi:DNA end-binding protein Ku
MAAARSVWKGFIQFSLVSVPVRAYAAAASAGSGGEVRLNQLHAECNSRIKYQKVCPVHGEVKQDEIVSGYEFAKDQYVIIDPGEIEKLRKPSEKAIGIEAFVKPDAIDERFYSGRTQYLLPEGAPAFKPYALLHRTLVETNRVAFAKVVLAGKQQLVVVRPLENLLGDVVPELCVGDEARRRLPRRVPHCRGQPQGTGARKEPHQVVGRG